MDVSGLKFLVVGAGPWGCVMAERIAEKLGERVLVIDRRTHPAGNCYSENDPGTGVEWHVYGSHIFHTSSPRVWEYVNRFDAFSTYRHKVLTEYRGKIYPMPISLATINAFYSLNLKPADVHAFIQSEIAGTSLAAEPDNLEDKAISLIGKPLYEAFIKGYTQKQWETDPRKLPPDIITRLPVRNNYNTDYFNNPWQGMPLSGYTALFTRMLTHPRIDLRLGVEYRDLAASLPPDCRILYSGPPDELFDYRFGRLEWRSLRFEKEVLDCADYQGTAVVNQADVEVPYTRTHEFKHLHPERGQLERPGTVITREYSKSYNPGDERYYPLNTARNQNIFTGYLREAEKNPLLLLGGRLGSYRYLDMDTCIDSALNDFTTLSEKIAQA